MKLCLDRLVPPPQDKPVNFDLPATIESPADFAKAQHAILQAVSQGEITPNEGETVSHIIDSRRRTWESTQLADRLTALENKADELKQSAGKLPKVTWVDPWDEPGYKDPDAADDPDHLTDEDRKNEKNSEEARKDREASEADDEDDVQ